MVPRTFTAPDLAGKEGILVRRLESLYEEEIQVYGQVLELSRRQGVLIRSGATMREIRVILEKKKGCLAIIGRLEATERQAKLAWDQEKSGWSAAGRTRMHTVLARVGEMIEKILEVEEDNDRQLIEKAGTV